MHECCARWHRGITDARLDQNTDEVSCAPFPRSIDKNAKQLDCRCSTCEGFVTSVWARFPICWFELAARPPSSGHPVCHMKLASETYREVFLWSALGYWKLHSIPRIHCILYTVNCILPSVHCIVYTVMDQCAVGGNAGDRESRYMAVSVAMLHLDAGGKSMCYTDKTSLSENGWAPDQSGT